MTTEDTADGTIMSDHESIGNLRQPLTAAIGRIQLARLRLRKGDYDHVHTDLRIAEEQCWRLEAMLRELA